LTKAGLLSSGGKQKEIEKMGKSRSTPVTPKKLSPGEREGIITPTPRRHGPGFMRDLASPSHTMPASSQKERKERRRMLEDEVDEAGGDEGAFGGML
jgi:hypothetical protein